MVIEMNESVRMMMIVNPTAGGYATKREWQSIQKYLKEHLEYSFDYCQTKYPGHATSLTKEAISNGYNLIVAIGGDGTINEVANGILMKPNEKTTLGVIGTGGSCCSIDSLGIPRDYYKAVSLLNNLKRRVIDVAAVDYMHQREKQRRYFINHADIGFGAEAIRRMSRISQKTGRLMAFLLRYSIAFASLSDHKNIPLEVNMDGKVLKVCSAVIIVENGRYFANRMLVAPLASLDDGLLDVVILNNVSRLELLSMLPQVYHGTYIEHPKVSIFSAKDIKIKSSERFYIEIDGEHVGEGPVYISVVPKALSVVS
jgi:YegS/Rv2252/BmrU family lipid kinase